MPPSSKRSNKFAWDEGDIVVEDDGDQPSEAEQALDTELEQLSADAPDDHQDSADSPDLDARIRDLERRSGALERSR